MSTITREWLQQAINDYESVRDELPFGLDDYQGNILSALRIALASLEAEPVAYIFKHPAGKLFWALTDESNKEQADVIPVYAAAPASVVPDNASEPLAYAYKELTPAIMRNHIAVFERYGITPNDSITTIHALRIALDGIERSDAMLHAGNFRENKNSSTNNFREIPETSTNSPVTPDGWISCSELMPDDGQHVIILCDGAFVLYAQYRDGEFFDIVRNGDEFFETQSRNVTDWMQLPEPPL